MIVLKSKYDEMREKSTGKYCLPPYRTEERRQSDVDSQFDSLLRSARK